MGLEELRVVGGWPRAREEKHKALKPRATGKRAWCMYTRTRPPHSLSLLLHLYAILPLCGVAEVHLPGWTSTGNRSIPPHIIITCFSSDCASSAFRSSSRKQQAAAASGSSSIIRAEFLAAAQPSRAVNNNSSGSSSSTNSSINSSSNSSTPCMRLEPLQDAPGFSLHPSWLFEGPSRSKTQTAAAETLEVKSSSSQRGCSSKKRVTSGHVSSELRARCGAHPGNLVLSACIRNSLRLLLLLLVPLILACCCCSWFDVVVDGAAADDPPLTIRRKWKGPHLHLPSGGPNDLNAAGGPSPLWGPSSKSRGPPSESSNDSASSFSEGGLGGLQQSSRGSSLVSQLKELAVQLQEGVRKASNALQQIKQVGEEGDSVSSFLPSTSTHADYSGASESEEEGSPTAAALAALNSTLQRLLSEFKRGLSLVFNVGAQDQASDTVDAPTNVTGRGAPRVHGGGPLDAGGGGGAPPASVQPQMAGGPSTQEARRLAQHLLYKLMPFDPTYHVLIKFYGVPTTPNRLTRALPSSVNRLWVTVLSRSFPSVFPTLTRRRVFKRSKEMQKEQIRKGGARRKRALQEAAASWFVSTHRVTMLGFCYSEQAQPVHPCSGNIAAGLDASTVQSLRSVLLENEALANFRLSGLGDLSRVAVLGREVTCCEPLAAAASDAAAASAAARAAVAVSAAAGASAAASAAPAAGAVSGAGACSAASLLCCFSLDLMGGNELAAQRVVRLLLAEPSLLFKGHNTMASVLMVVPQYWGGSGGVRGGPPPFDQGAPPFSLSPDFHRLGAPGFGGRLKGASTPCGDGKGGPCSGLSEGVIVGGPPPCSSEASLATALGGPPACRDEEIGDPNVHLLIEMSGEGPGLDIRSFPQQIVQLISADPEEQNSTNLFFPQEDYSPQDSISINSSSGEMPSPTRKFIDASRIILQGTCRRVVSATGASTLLKTREFGVNLSVQQRRSVEMQLPESRILVHIEILGVSLSTQPAEPPPSDVPLDYFVGPRFLSEHKELAPYTAVDAANLIRLRIADQFRHVWGNARVVLWETDHTQQEMGAKGVLQEEGQPGKSDYQTWKILVAVLVPSFVVGALVVVSWHSTSICKCVGSGANGNDSDTSAASPPTDGSPAGAKEKSFTQREAA
ncbi:hypothetical protein Emed_006889 [Eimeria media]